MSAQVNNISHANHKSVHNHVLLVYDHFYISHFNPCELQRRSTVSLNVSNPIPPIACLGAVTHKYERERELEFNFLNHMP